MSFWRKLRFIVVGGEVKVVREMSCLSFVGVSKVLFYRIYFLEFI